VSARTRSANSRLSTHRYSLLSLVNRLIVLDKGRIAADGPKDKVLEALQRKAKAAGQETI
jgi:ATP-binding cassette subfamily C protein LapB